MEVVRETCERHNRCTEAVCPEDCQNWKDNFIRRKYETRKRPVELTPAELLKAGDELSAALEQLTLLGLELETIKKQYKGRTAEVDGRIAALSALVRAKIEMRDVAVVVVSDHKTGKVTTIVQDTEGGEAEEILEERDMTDDEKQRHMEFGEEWELAQEAAQKAKEEDENPELPVQQDGEGDGGTDPEGTDGAGEPETGGDE